MGVWGHFGLGFMVALSLAACGSRSALPFGQGSASDAPRAGSDTGRSQAVRRVVGSMPRSVPAMLPTEPTQDEALPDKPLRTGNYCVGFGLGDPVVDHPPEALPLLCGLDCSDGQPCPDGAECMPVYFYGRDDDGRAFVSDEVAALQCLPTEGRCALRADYGEYCGACDADSHCN